MDSFEIKLTKAEYEQLNTLNNSACELGPEQERASVKLHAYAAWLCTGAGHSIQEQHTWSFSKRKGGKCVLSVCLKGQPVFANPF